MNKLGFFSRSMVELSPNSCRFVDAEDDDLFLTATILDLMNMLLSRIQST
jgi:hypothetical protein